MSNYVCIRLLDLPAHVNGVTIPSDDGYDVYINSNICEKKKKSTIAHELRHIYGDHFCGHISIKFSEDEAENGPEPDKRDFILLTG